MTYQPLNKNLKYPPANAISGNLGGGNDDEAFAAAKNVNLFLNICKIISTACWYDALQGFGTLLFFVNESSL